MDRDVTIKFSKIVIFAGALAITATTIAPVNAFGLGGLSRKSTPKIECFASPTRVPVTFQFFCLQSPKYCGGSKADRYCTSLKRKLAYVNRKVNRSIKPQNERRDVWSVGVSRGDCEDYVLTKRRDLIRSGVSAGALKIAVVRTRGGVGHAVLVVKTNKGDLVLDNRRSSIVKSYQSGYRFIEMSSNQPKRWEKINNSKYKRSDKSVSRSI